MKEKNIKILVLMGVFFTSFSSILVKFSTSHPLIIATYRLLFTSIILLPIVITKERENLKKLNLKMIAITALSGIFLAIHFSSWFLSLRYTTVASSTVLVDTHSLFVVIFSYVFLKEKVSKKALFFIFLTFIGSIVISFGDFSLGKEALFGDFLAIIGAFSVSLYMIIGRSVRRYLNVNTYTFLVYSFCAITLIILDIIFKVPFKVSSNREYMIFLGLAVVCTLLGHSVFNFALEHVKATFVSTALLAEPIFASVMAIIFFKEMPKVTILIGGFMVLFGIYNYIKVDSRDKKAA
ncbi:MAG: DMT family transporter [Peptostreptococcaceae bacterium]|nr:DMT family transporter [Peptostreptococcaceae bacterium]